MCVDFPSYEKTRPVWMSFLTYFFYTECFFRSFTLLFKLMATIFVQFSKADMIWKLELLGKQVFFTKLKNL